MVEDPKLSQRYRELGSEEPPKTLDASILVAARRALDRPHAPLVAPVGRHRWYFSLAAAAVLILVVAVTIHIERQPDPEALAAPSAQETRDAQPRSRAERAAPPKSPPPTFARDPSPPAPVVQAPASPPAPQDELKAERRSAGAAADSAAKPSRAPAIGRMAEQAQRESPERGLERIAQLRKDGRHEEADKALAEFRRRYPDYRIPAAMLERVER